MDLSQIMNVFVQICEYIISLIGDLDLSALTSLLGDIDLSALTGLLG